MRNLVAAVLVFTLGAFVTSCSSSPTAPEAPRREVRKASAAIEQEYRTAEATERAGNHKKALTILKKLTPQANGTDLMDQVAVLTGNVQFALQQYGDALAHYNLARNDSAAPANVRNDASLHAARTLLKLSRASEADEILANASDWPTPTPEQTLDAEKLRYESLALQKKNTAALQMLVSVADKTTNTVERDKYRALAQEYLETRLNEDELKDIAGNSKSGFLQAPAKLRYAGLLNEKRQYSQARGVLTEVSSSFAGTEYADRANALLQQLDARSRVDARTIGVVLPLSGKQGLIGTKVLHAIQLGLGIFGSTKSNYRLAVVDSEGNPDAARRAVEKLVQEDNVIAIIGGLLSKTATTEATKAQELGVPTIMLSQKAGVTQAGESIFRNALTSDMQVQQLVELSMSEFGYHNFAIIYPNDPYGVEYANLFWDAVKAHGGEITGAQTYDPKETDFRGHVQRLIGTFYLEDRSEEYRQKSRQYYEKNPKRSVRSSAPLIEDILPPIADFDAVFIPDSARAVGQIVPMLAYNNVSKVRLLGTNLWNSPATVSRGQKFVENSLFVDSVISTDPAFRNSEFFGNYKKTFDDEPGMAEVQAYDSAIILRQILVGGENTRVGLQSRLSRLQNFPGVLGPLSIGGEREIRRPLTTLTIKSGKIIPLETAAK